MLQAVGTQWGDVALALTEGPGHATALARDAADGVLRVIARAEARRAGEQGWAGSRPGRAIKTTVYLVDMADFGAMNEVYARHFGSHRPARSTVAVAGLPKGARVEIEVQAWVD